MSSMSLACIEESAENAQNFWQLAILMWKKRAVWAGCWMGSGAFGENTLLDSLANCVPRPLWPPSSAHRWTLCAVVGFGFGRSPQWHASQQAAGCRKQDRAEQTLHTFRGTRKNTQKYAAGSGQRVVGGGGIAMMMTTT